MRMASAALRVEYFEHVSWAELRVEIVKP